MFKKEHGEETVLFTVGKSPKLASWEMKSGMIPEDFSLV